MSTCRSYGAPLLWAITIEGNRMPLDAEPNPAGQWITINGIAHYVGNEPEPPPQPDYIPRMRPRYTTHWATCPNAAAHRRKPS